MGLNLVQFADLRRIDGLSRELKDTSVLVAADFSAEGLSEFRSAKGAFATKFFSCKVLPRKEGPSLQAFSKLADFIAVRGGSVEMNSWAANQKGIDILLQPFTSEKNSLDLATANLLAEKNVYTCFLFNEFLQAEGFRLSQLIKNASQCLKILGAAGARVMFASGAVNEGQMRASKDLSSFGAMLGMKKENALKAAREGAEKFLERVQ